MKKFWLPAQMLHSMLGIFVLIGTIIFAMKVSHHGFLHFHGGLHNILGSVFVIIAILGALSGFTASATMKFYKG